MKTLVAASIITLLFSAVPAYAEHDLAQKPAQQEPADSHISWHEFRHDLGSYAGVTASIDHHGVITLAGHADSSPDKRKINQLAVKVRGATNVINLIGTD